jgi:hypothetical protein
LENLDLTAKVAVEVGVSTAKSGSGVDLQFNEAIPQGTNTNAHQFRGSVFIPIAAIQGFFQIPALNFF